MRNDFYPQGTVQSLLQTDLVTQQTKKVLQKRLATQTITDPAFFTEAEFRTLQAVCQRLLPQPENRTYKIDLAGILDTNFKEGKTDNGWRYNAMPPDEEAYKLGLQAIELTSQSQYRKHFHELSGVEQDAILENVQNKNVENELWTKVPCDLFFTELLASLSEMYYSHPVGKNEIGDASMADAEGWRTIKLNELQPQEPEAIGELK